MDTKSCSKSSDLVLEVVNVADDKGQTSASISKDDSRIVKDDVIGGNILITAVPEEVTTTVKCQEEEESGDTSKGKEFYSVDLEESERICRICHFGADQTPDRVSGKSVSSELIEIGCKCKNDLGLAHAHCAEAWFKLRGNNVCEICGCTAKNVTVRLTEEWNEGQQRDGTLVGRRRHGRGQSCCIFMIFLLTILLLHWFFKKLTGYYKNGT